MVTLRHAFDANSMKGLVLKILRKTLEKEFLAKRISKLLTSTIAKNEFSATFLKKHITPF